MQPAAIGSAATDAIQDASSIVIGILLSGYWSCGNRMAEYPDVMPAVTVAKIGPELAITYYDKIIIVVGYDNCACG